MSDLDEGQTDEMVNPETASNEPQAPAAEPDSDTQEPKSIEDLKAAADAVPVAPAEGGEGDDEPVAAIHEPNLKFKVMDQEHEIDKAFAPLMKDPESEAKIRELHEKAFGLDHVKQDRDQYRDTANEIKSAYEKQSDAINQLSSYLDHGDYETFFKALDIPSKDILKYALNQVQKQNMTPEQRAEYDQQWNDKRRAYTYEQQYNSNQQTLAEMQQRQVVQEYNLELHKPEVQEFEKAFDQRNGEGAFRTEVAQLGEYQEKVHSNILPVGTLVKHVMEKYGPWVGQQQAAAQPAQAPAAQPAAQTPAVAAQDVPTIPNTGPAGQAPTAPVIKSLEDLEKIAQSM